MPKLIQRSFTGGEIAPALRARADVSKYAYGLALCENFFIRSQGGVYSRPGLRFIGEARTNQIEATRLIPFIFSQDQAYILLFQATRIRIIRDGAFITPGGFIYEVEDTDYTADELYEIDYVQDADVMTLTHPNHPVKILYRLADDNWVLAEQSYDTTVDSPTWAEISVGISNITNANPAVVTTSSAHNLVPTTIIGISGVNGMTEVNGNEYKVGNVLSSTSFELSDINGIPVDSSSYSTYLDSGTVTQSEIEASGDGAGTYTKTYRYVVTAVDENGIESLPSESRSITTNSLSETAGVKLSWNAVVGADYYRVYKDPSEDTGTYGWIGDTENTRFIDYNIAPVTSDAPPNDRDPFDEPGDYPSAVGYYQQRQIFANTLNNPQTVFATQAGVYNSFRTSIPARDDDAIEFTIKARQVNAIRHIVSLDSLILLTSDAEWRVTEGQDQVFTPSTIGVKVQSYNGAAAVKPTVVDDTVIYVQEKGSRLRDIKYQFADDKFSGSDLSIMAEHLFEGASVVQMAFSREPYGVLWVVMDNGKLLGLTYHREHQVWAWHQHVTDGDFESVAVIPEDGRDAVYVSVRRIIGGNEKQYIERMEPRVTSDPADTFCVDSGLSYDGTATATFAGLDHLEGKDVVAVADGNEVTGLTVSGGEVTLPMEASKVVIGLPYTCSLETLDIDTPSETIRGREVSVSKVTLQVEKSRGGWIGPKREDGTTGQMIEIKPRFDSYGYDPIPLRDFKQEVVIDPGWGKAGGIRIEQRAPFPMAILAVIPDVDIS